MDSIPVLGVPPLLKLRWLRRRWTLRHLWYRARLPARRRRWWRDRSQLAVIYKKAPNAKPSSGAAVVLGDFSGKTGISRGAIYDLSRLRACHAKLILVDISDYIAGKTVVVELREPIENIYFLCQPDVYEHVLGLVAPESIRNAYRVGRWVWETAELPNAWNFACDIIHEVWAPSNFCGSVFARCLSLPVHVIPHAVVAPPPSSVNMRARLGIGDDKFLGLAIMDIRSCPQRKNPWAHVLAWQTAFGSDDNALLLMKVLVSKRTALVLAELKELIGDNKNVKLMTDYLSEEELSSLQRSCDVFLSLHRSEGYGLNIHEALLSGRPTLATDWSANREYGQAFPNYRGIRYRLVPYRDWTNHYENGNFHWAEPNIAHAAAELRSVRELFRAKGL